MRSRHKKTLIQLIVIAISLLHLQYVSAGSLSNFEKAAKGETKQSSSSSSSSSSSHHSSHHSSHSSSNDDDSSLLADIIFGLFSMGSDSDSSSSSSKAEPNIVTSTTSPTDTPNSPDTRGQSAEEAKQAITASSSQSTAEVEANAEASTGTGVEARVEANAETNAVASTGTRVETNAETRNQPPYSVSNRTLGSPIAPYFRLDLGGNFIDTGIGTISGKDHRLEAGYDAFAFSYQQTRFTEDDVEEGENSQLRIKQSYLKWRLPSSDAVFEIDFGLGLYEIKGEEVNQGLAITAPILFHPSSNFGVELRPSYSSDKVTDVELSFITGWDFVKFKAGVRWINVDGASLDNVFAGLIFVL